MTYKVLIGSKTFGKITSEPEEILRKEGYEIIHNPYPEFFNEKQLIDAIRDVDAMVVGFDEVTENVLERASKLKVLAKHGVGVDNIDITAATKHRIIVCNTVGANESGVADLAIGLMISVARQIPFANREVKNQKWPKVFGTELWEKTLGIVGLGHIGKGVAIRAHGFSMTVLAYDPYPDKQFADRHGIQFVTLEELLQKADFVTIHVPLNKDTKNMIGKKQLAMMKESAFLINTARGEIVNEESLYTALKEKLIRGAALDAFALEPAGASKILEIDSLIATPHMGAYTEESLNRMSLMCARAIVAVLKGLKPDFVVNPEIYEE